MSNAISGHPYTQHICTLHEHMVRIMYVYIYTYVSTWWLIDMSDKHLIYFWQAIYVPIGKITYIKSNDTAVQL